MVIQLIQHHTIKAWGEKVYLHAVYIYSSPYKTLQLHTIFSALLTRVRKEMWPLPQSVASEGILKPSPVAAASKGTGPKWGPSSHNM